MHFQKRDLMGCRDNVQNEYLFFTKDVVGMKKEKMQLFENHYVHEQVVEYVNNFYRAGSYSYLQGKDNCFFVMPSTSGINTIPVEFAKRLKSDFGGIIVDNYAIPLHLLEAKSKGFIGKIRSPSRYRVIKNLGKYFGKISVMVDDVLNTGESVAALKRELMKHGIKINSVAVLGISESRTVCENDISRFTDKLARCLGMESSVLKTKVDMVFAGHNKQFLNYAERCLHGRSSYEYEIFRYIQRETKKISRDGARAFEL